MFRAAAPLRLLVHSRSWAFWAAPECSAPSHPSRAHTYTSNFYFPLAAAASFSRALPVALRCPGRGARPAAAWPWLRAAGDVSSHGTWAVPCSEALKQSLRRAWERGGDVLWNLPLLMFRTGVWGGERGGHLFLTAFSVCSCLYPSLLLWYAQIWGDLRCVLQPNSWLELEKYNFTPTLLPWTLERLFPLKLQKLLSVIPQNWPIFTKKNLEKNPKKSTKNYGRSEWTWTLCGVFWKGKKKKRKKRKKKS